MQSHIKSYLWLSSLFFFLIIAPCQAQETIVDRPEVQEEALTTTTLKPISLRMNEVLRVKIPQLPSNPTGKIAVFLGATDITSQIEFEGKDLIYKSSLAPLAIGEQTLTIYTIRSTNFWDKLASFRIRVEPNFSESLNQIKLPVGEPPPSSTTEVVKKSIDPQSAPVIAQGSTPPADSPAIPAESKPPVPEIAQPSTPPTIPAGTTPTTANLEPNSTFTPRFNGNIKSQVLDIRNPNVATQRPTFINVDFTGGLSTENQIGKTKIKSKFTVVGTSFQPESLRFSELREGASQIDLSEYAIESNDGNNQFTVGNVCFGNHPFLINNLCTRGLSAKVKL